MEKFTIEKHDTHYRNAETQGVEPIKVMEMIIQRDSAPLLSLYHVSLAMKYLMRIGLKNDNWEQELDKAINYLHRAKTGKWKK